MMARRSGTLLKHFCHIKVTIFLKMTLLEKDKLISDESKVANSSSNFFKSAIQHLALKQTNILMRVKV